MKFSSLLPYITPHRKLLLATVGLLLGSSIMSLTQPWLAGELTATLLDDTGKSAWSIQAILLLWLGLIMLRSLLGFFTQYTIGSTGESMTARLRSRLYQHLQALPLSYYQERRRGDVLALLTNDADIISGFVTNTLVQLLPLLLTFVGAFVMMAWINPLIALLAVMLLPAYFLLMKIIGRGIRPVSRAWIDAYSDLVSFIDENLGMLPAIKSFTRENEEESRFEQHNHALLGLSKKEIFIQALLSPIAGLMAGLGMLLLLWLGTGKIASGELAAAELVSLLLYAMLLSQPLKGLANVYGQVQRTRGAAERIVEFFNQQAEPDDAGKPPLNPVRGDIRFETVHFAYRDDNPVLEGLDIHIRAGETVAITGVNGAGKSTLAHLLMRMADPLNGRILIDNVDISSVSVASLRRQIGLVAQHTLLLNGTVAENIAYGLSRVEQEAIEEAARWAHAHEFISQLPDGYETLIGDQGLRLSGGQRQRLSLARTLLTNPPILILDEATSMFDPAGEDVFIAECEDLLAERTVLLITHRPAALKLADREIKLAGRTTQDDKKAANRSFD